MEGLIWQNPNPRKMGSYQTPMISAWPAREGARPRGLRGAGWNVRPSLLPTLNIRFIVYWIWRTVSCSGEWLMPKGVLILRNDYPFSFPSSYHFTSSSGFAFLLLKFLKVFIKILMIQIKYRLRFFLIAFQS